MSVVTKENRMGYGYKERIISTITQGRLYLYMAVLMFSSLTPAFFFSSTADAVTTFSNYAITSGYKNIGEVTTAAGSLWYREVDPNAPDPYTYYDIGNITTNGVVTNYNLRTLSGNSNLVIASVTTGSDGNVWFSGTNGGSALAGVLNIAAGTVTLYPYSSVPVYSNGPGQIVSGSDGNIYYLAKSANDYYTYIIYVNPTTGATGTIGNSGYPGYFTSIAASSDGFIWVTEPQNRNILGFHIVGGSGGYAYLVPGTTYPGSYPGNIVSGPDGNIWFTDNDSSNSYIYKLTRSNGTFTKYVSSGGQLTAGSDGAVWFLDGAKIGRISSSGGITEYTVPNSGNTKGGLVVGPGNALWFTYADSAGLKVGSVFVTPDFSGYPITAGYKNTAEVTTAAGALWYREVDPNAPNPYTYYDIGKMTTSGTVTDYNIRTLSGNANLAIYSLTTGSDGNVWFSGITNTGGGSAMAGVLNVTTGAVTIYPYNAVPAYSSGIGQIVSGSDGNLYYLAKSGNNSYTYIVYVNPTTGATGTIGNSGYPGYFTSIAASPDGFIWVTEPQNRNVLAFHIVGGSGSYAYLVPGTTYPGSYPGNIVSGPDGNIWFTDNDSSNSYIFKLTRSSGTFTKYPISASQLTAGPDGAVWFLDTGSTNKIGRISSAGTITEYTIPNSGNTKGSLAIGPDGAMWFTYGDSSGLKIGRLGY